MNIIEINQDYSVAPQITVEDVQAIADQGFRSIMCNRPDNESPGQPPVADIRAEAERIGLDFSFVPVVSGQIQPENITDFQAAIETLPKPVLAYCRSGARCGHLLQMVGI